MIFSVIGGNGYIGSAIIKFLQSMGHEPYVPQKNQIDLQRDLGNVFYCAGYTNDYLINPVDLIEAHIGLLSRILQSNKYSSLVYLSSTRLYDDLGDGVIALEETPLPIQSLKTRHLFDTSKLAGESLCTAFGGGRAKVARLSCVYSKLSNHGFFAELLSKLEKAKPGAAIKINSNKNNYRDYIEINDVVLILYKILLEGKQEIYNVASGENTTNENIQKILDLKTNKKIIFTLEDGLQNNVLVSIDKIKKEFDIEPKKIENFLSEWLLNND